MLKKINREIDLSNLKNRIYDYYMISSFILILLLLFVILNFSVLKERFDKFYNDNEK